MKKSIYTVDQIDALLSGKGLAILGRYDSANEITDPVEGGHYYIGTEEPYDVYTYVNGAWVNAGPLAIAGPPGPAFTYEDFTEEQLAALVGPPGEPGKPFTYEDFTPEQLEALVGPAGSSIQSIDRTSGDGSPGSIDTYTITLTNGSKTTFQVYNGKDGAGSGTGDMLASTYDTEGKKTDIFKFVANYAQPKGDYLTYETDPTVPSWAKAASKPSYTKSEVGLGNVDNVKQYSANNPPPYPVTSVNGKTGAVTVAVPAVLQETGESETAVMSQKAVTDALGYPPDYWMEELDTKADAIQISMEAAGQNKSSFLWYTDSHWQYSNSKMSPRLLKYLIDNTPINKVNFGGDIVSDPSAFIHDNIKYVYQWRRMVRDLPNHHSVIGNHDFFQLNDGNVTDAVKNAAYAFLIAPEESADMVVGGEFYYYIDSPSEKTRYFYLDSGNFDLSDAETQFVVDGLISLEIGWHAVFINHIWFQYTHSNEPTVGSINAYCQKLLNVLDNYNARANGTVTMVSSEIAYDFTNAVGKVEFCIGGHIHYDYDLFTDGGIPIIMTAPDTNQVRGEDTFELGTITESAVGAIIANYNDNAVSVIGVGRMKSRTLPLPVVSEPEEELVNLLDTVGYTDGLRYSASSAETRELSTATAFNKIDISGFKSGDVLRIYNPNGYPDDTNSAYVLQYRIGSAFATADYIKSSLTESGRPTTSDPYEFDVTIAGTILTLTARKTPSMDGLYISMIGEGANCIVTFNQEITDLGGAP